MDYGLQLQELDYRRKCLLFELETVTKKIMDEFAATKSPIEDESDNLKRLVFTIEKIFKFEFKEIYEGLFSGPIGYTKVIEGLPKFIPESTMSVTTVWEMNEIKTIEGKGRAWFKLVLMEGKLDTYLLPLINNQQYLMGFYTNGSVFCTREDATKFVSITALLNDIEFNLYPKDMDKPLKIKLYPPKFGLRQELPIKFTYENFQGHCSWCFGHTNHLSVPGSSPKLSECKKCRRKTIYCKNECGNMARFVPNGSRLCAHCSNEITDWGLGYVPPSNIPQKEVKVEKVKPQVDQTDELLANLRKELSTDKLIDDKKKKTVKKKVKARPVDIDATADAATYSPSSSSLSNSLYNGTATSFGTSLIDPTPSVDLLSNSQASNYQTISTSLNSPVKENDGKTNPNLEESPPKQVEIKEVKKEEKLNDSETAEPLVSSPSKNSPTSDNLPRTDIIESESQKNIKIAETVESKKIEEQNTSKKNVKQEEVNNKPPVIDTAKLQNEQSNGTPNTKNEQERSPSPSPLTTRKQSISVQGMVISTTVVSPMSLLEESLQVNENDDKETAGTKIKLIEKMRERARERDKEIVKSVAIYQDFKKNESEVVFSPTFKDNTLEETYPRPKLPSTPQERSVPTTQDETGLKKDHWVPDDQAEKCQILGCDVEFSFFNRRHHCRKCGRVICGKHSGNVLKLNTNALPDPKGFECKVCDECYLSYRHKSEQDFENESFDANSVKSLKQDDEQAMSGLFMKKKMEAAIKKERNPANLSEIYFTIHSKPSKIDEFCSDCGCALPTGFLSSARYCEATGRYFCTNCHHKDTSIVPGRVLQNWDFSRFEVCDKSHRMLQMLYTEPMYSIDAINPGLYEEHKALSSMKNLRKQLDYLHSYLITCSAKKNSSVMEILSDLRTFDPDKYSMKELFELKEGLLLSELEVMTKELRSHVYDCELCKAKGFICEICKNPKVFYSFELDLSHRCTECKSFFHADCFSKSSTCPKCDRIKKYKSKAL